MSPEPEPEVVSSVVSGLGKVRGAFVPESQRAQFAAKLGADAIQVALPFWLEVDDRQLVGFFKEVSKAAGGLPLTIYESLRAKKAMTIEQHRAIKEAVPFTTAGNAS